MDAQINRRFAWRCCSAARVKAVHVAVQVPAVRQPPLQIRTLNTAASVPSSTAANLAAIDPPVQTSQTGSPESQVEFRAQWAHALRNALRSTKHLESVMESMDRYLRTAKAEVDEGGKSSLFLDHQIISNYIDCEDVLISYDLQHIHSYFLMRASVPGVRSAERVNLRLLLLYTQMSCAGITSSKVIWNRWKIRCIAYHS